VRAGRTLERRERGGDGLLRLLGRVLVAGDEAGRVDGEGGEHEGHVEGGQRELVRVRVRVRVRLSVGV
jgi:hypothetical protein